MFLLPFMNVFGAWDSGVYPNIAGNIDRTGSVFYEDAVLSELSEPERDLFYRDLYDAEGEYKHSTVEPGFYLTDPERGTVTPQFFYFFPSLLAVGMAFTGVRAGFLLLTAFALLSLAGMYLLAREFMGGLGALLASLFLAVNTIQVYFSKYATSEILAQTFFLAGAFAFIKYRRAEASTGRGWWGFVAGASFGCMLLAHIDAILMLGPLVLLYCFYYIREGTEAIKRDWCFLAPYLALVTFTAVLSAGPYRTYVDDIGGSFIAVIPGGWFTVAGAVVAVIVLSILLRSGFGNVFELLYRNRRKLAVAACVILIVLAVLAMFVRPQVWSQEGLDVKERSYDAASLPRLVYYLTPLGALLALAGYCLFILREGDSSLAILPLSGLVFTIVFIYRPLITPLLIYSMRRYVIVVLPVAVMMAAYAISALYGATARWRTEPSSWKLSVATMLCAALVIALVGWGLYMSAPIARTREFRESYPYVRTISEVADGDSLIICDTATARMVAPPLKYILGRRVLGLVDDSSVDDPALADVVERFERQGDVYFLAAYGSKVASRTNRLTFEEVEVLRYRTRLLANTRDEPTTDIVDFDISIEVYEVSAL